MFDPYSGGKKVPVSVQFDVERQIRKVAEEHFQGCYTHLEVRFRGQCCYIDAYAEPQVRENWPSPDWPESREAYQERIRKTPVHICRLHYFDDDQWGFAFFTYSNEKYELSVYPNGEFLGTPEDSLVTSANLSLSE